MSDPFSPCGRTDAEELLLELLDMPISFHRCFVTITGKVTAALLLSYLWWSEEEAPEAEGWTARQIERIREDTGLSRDELVTARRILRDLAIVEERRIGMPARLELRVQRLRVAQLLVEHVRTRQALRRSTVPAQEDSYSGRLPH